MKVFVSNAFALSMLDRAAQLSSPRSPIPIDVNRVKDILFNPDNKVVSVVGHADVAAQLSNITGVDLPVNRVSIKLTEGDVLLVGQYVGPRLPEGTTTLPEGSVIEWWAV